MQADQVSDTHGNFVAAGPLGTFSVNIWDVTPPVATLAAADVTSTGTSYEFTVTYADPDDGVSVTSMGNKDIVVTGPNGFSQPAHFVTVDNSTNGTPRTATYQITPPDVRWTPADNGTYTVVMQADQVSDTHGNFVVAGPLGTFSVNIWDVTPPVATLTAANVTSTATSYEFTVTYSDPNVAISVTTLGNKDIVVTGPNGFNQPAHFVAVDNATNGTPRTATYQITPPDVRWTPADNGTYTVVMQADQVSDTVGNFVAAGRLGTFSINLWDVTPPVATLSAPSVTAGGGKSYQFAVTYTDPHVGISIATLGSKDILVTGPNGFSQLAHFVTADQMTDGTPRTATYRITPPNGTWGASDDGTYTVAMQADQVGDTVGNFVPAGTLGSFSIEVSDTTPPVATLAAANVVSAGGSSYAFYVTYTDNCAVSVATLDGNDVFVRGPGGFIEAVKFLGVDNPADGTPRTATYQITPPGGAWNTAANGMYAVWIQAKQVSDTHGNFVPAGDLGYFTVSIHPALSIANVAIPEGNSGTTRFNFVVTLAAASTRPIKVGYATQNGTATAGSDYRAVRGTLTFAPGQFQETITVPVLGDKLYENDETFSVNLTDPAGGGALLAIGTGTILNDDPPPSLSIGNVSVKEGNRGTTKAPFTVTLSTASGRITTVAYATADGTATTADGDYQAAAGTLTFQPGQTKKTITVLINGDTKYEPNETFFVNLGDAVGATLAKGTGTGTIQNDDKPPAASPAPLVNALALQASPSPSGKRLAGPVVDEAIRLLMLTDR